MVSLFGRSARLSIVIEFFKSEVLSANMSFTTSPVVKVVATATFCGSIPGSAVAVKFFETSKGFPAASPKLF